jgi:hypothetical protein
MALQTINLGNYPNDGTGDDLRTAFVKVNANFQQLDLLQAQDNTGTNVGTGTGIFQGKTGVNLDFRSFTAGSGINVSISNTGNEIIIANSAGNISVVNASTGTFVPTSNSTFSIIGGTNISTAISGSTLTINNTFTVQTDQSPQLGGNLNTGNYNVTGSGTITAGNFNGPLTGNVTGNVVGNLTGNVIGNLTGLVNGIDVSVLSDELNSFDLGGLIPIVTDFISFIRLSSNLDMGSFTSPNQIILDNGSF